MKTIQFKHNNKKAGLIVFILFMLLLVGFAIIIISGAFGILDFINDNGGRRYSGYVFLLLFLPFILIAKKLVVQIIKINFNTEYVEIINGSTIKKVDVNSISKIEIINRQILKIYNGDKLIYTFNSAAGIKAIGELKSAILAYGKFRKINSTSTSRIKETEEFIRKE